MKKIIFLNAFIQVMLVIYVINYLANAYLVFFTDFLDNYKTYSAEFVFGNYTQFVGLAISIFTFVGLFFIKIGVSITIKDGYFIQSSTIKFKKAGLLFLISGICSLIFDALLFYNSQEILFISNLGQDFFLIIIGFSLYIITDIINNGSIIKHENDLTI